MLETPYPDDTDKQQKTKRTMMEKRHGLRPLVRLELPRLARRQDAHHPVPRVAPEFHERVDAVYDVIPRLRTALLAGGVDVREGAVNGDDVLRT